MLEVTILRRLQGFTLDVGFATDSQVLVLFGPSGSGKSMTLRCIAGIVRPDSGRIAIASRVLFDSETGVNLHPQERRAGYVPQRYALFPHLSVEENVAFGLPRMSKRERERHASELLNRMGLSGLARFSPQELSGGQQQRVALARAMAFRPDILLLDEPFGALDVATRNELRDSLLALKRETGVTIVIVTHDLGDAFLLGEKIVVLDNGQVMQDGSREDIFYRPATRRVAELVATRNVFRGQITATDHGLTEVRWKGVTLRVKEAPVGIAGNITDFCIRPTQIMIKPPEVESYADRRNVFCGDIVDEIAGAETHRLFVRLKGSIDLYDLEIELPGYVYFRLSLDQNKEIEMSVRPEVIHLIPTPDSA